LLKEKLNKFLTIDPIGITLEILSDGAIKKQIEDWNRQQLLDGENSLGIKLSDIGGGYSEYTLYLHPEKKKDVVNLYDTGEFHDSIKVAIDNDLIFTANPLKRDDDGRVTNLFKEWGDDIIGLNDENLQNLINKVKDILISEILRQI